MARLAFGDPEAVVVPIDIVQRECRYFAGPQPVTRQQQQDRIVTPAGGAASIHPFQDQPDLVPRDRPRNARKAIGLRVLHGPAQVLCQNTLAVQVAEKGPQLAAASRQACSSNAPAVFGNEPAQDDRGETPQTCHANPLQV